MAHADEHHREMLTDQAKAHIDLFKHWDNSFWSAVSGFLASQSFLVGAFFVVIARADPSHPTFKFAGFPLCIVGLLLTVVWGCVFAVKRAYVEAAETLSANALPALYGERKNRSNGRIWVKPGMIWTKRLTLDAIGVSSSYLVSVGLPTLIAILWILGLLLTFKTQEHLYGSHQAGQGPHVK